jgi:[ribosomal protein S5]-alanine N-acetyltransferase
VITTRRLRLRDFVPADFESVHAYASDPLVTRFTAFGPNTAAQSRQFLARVVFETLELPRRHFNFAVMEVSSGKVIGGCGLDLAHPDGPQYALGYCLHRHWWGARFGTEAVEAMVAFGFDDLDAWRVFAHVYPGNEASARLLQGLGFRHEGTHRESTRVRGQWRDEMVFALLRREWRTGGTARH